MPPAAAALLHRVGDAVCTTDWAQRQRISRTLLAAAICVGCVSIASAAAFLGLADPHEVQVVSVPVVTGVFGFYLALRSGWNRRLADPAMTFAQMLFGVAACMFYYAVMAPIRSAMLLVLAQMIAFGMFSMSPAQLRRLAACAIGMFAATTALLAATRPVVYEPKLELIHFVVVATVLAVVTVLASEFAQLRTGLRRQRTDLKRALGRLQRLVRQDELTGLVNRRFMQERLEEERQRRLRDVRPASLCMVDLDHFKRINDRFGHAAGDAVLKRFADIATECLRSIDVLARWGGEEFLLLLPETDAATAEPLLERLRAALADPARWRDQPQWQVSFSAGLTTWRPDEPAEAAIERADRAAYRAKADGRDRWCTG